MKKNLLLQLGIGTGATQTSGSKPAITNTFVRPEMSGNTNYDHLFKGVKKKTDDFFGRFVNSQGEKFSDGPREYQLFQTGDDTRSDSAIISALNICNFVTPGELRATMEYLNTDEGKKLLAIPQGEEEVNFILGYAKDENEKPHVLFVEHELEHGEEEIHFHSRPLDRWRNDNPSGVVEVQK